MRLYRRIEFEGTVLFRWRSYIPLILLLLALLAITDNVTSGSPIESGFAHLFVYGCMAISVLGQGIRIVTVGFSPDGTSGRNTRAQRADLLNTTGIYSIVRNPLYLGNFLVILGIALALKVWWFPIVVSLAYWLYIERVIAAEETYLAEKFGDVYEAWVLRTPAFLPKFSNWVASEHGFSWRMILRREYNGILAIGAAYLFLEFVIDVLVAGEELGEWVHEDVAWLAIFVVALIVFVVLRTLKKHTAVLKLK